MSSSGFSRWIQHVSLSALAAAAWACEGTQRDFGTTEDSGISGSGDGSVVASLQPACAAGLQEVCWALEDGTAPTVDVTALMSPCGPGRRTCEENGSWGPCLGAVLPQAADRCDVPGADDDCDGQANEDCPCEDGATRSCGIETGNCTTGTQECTDNLWGPCTGQVAPATRDACDVLGDDADCDGDTNEGCSCLSGQSEACGECGTRICDAALGQWGPCTGSGQAQTCWETPAGQAITPEVPATPSGNCRLGSQTCGEDGNWAACEGAVGPVAADRCDVAGDDADCDGFPNEDCACVDGATRRCGSDTGNCVRGTQTCSDQTWGSCVGEVAPQTLDSCAAANDDANCNGTLNDGCPCIANQTRPCNDCGTQTCDPANRTWGACRGPSTTVTQCSSETVVQTCNANGIFASSTCNFVCTGDRCGGECRAPATRCQNAQRQACVAGFFQTQETCGAGKVCGAGGQRCLSTLGGSCSVDADCQSGACVAGICCSTRCPAVNCPASTNECVSVPATVSTNLCNATGACRTAQDVCTAATTFPGENISCDPELDQGGAAVPFLPPGRCDGDGECAVPTVACGGDVCSVDVDVCCQTFPTALSTTPTHQCVSRNIASGSRPTGLDCGGSLVRIVTCDEPSDCQAGEVCCSDSGQGGTRFRCAAATSCTGAGTGVATPICASPVASFPACPGNLQCMPMTGLLVVTGYSTCR